MILTAGELLADLFGQRKDNSLQFSANIGGAPFNACVGAVQAGAQAVFVGRVGTDVIGTFLSDMAKKIGFSKLVLQKDTQRNTTLAFVTLDKGERSFSFFRNNTADSYLETFDLNAYGNVSIFHIGTLMLSEKHGQAFARTMLKQAKQKQITIAVDANFRPSLFACKKQMLAAFSDVIEYADILKLSDDELCLLENNTTDTSYLASALASIAKRYPHKFIAITAGSKGSYFIREGKITYVPVKKVLTPIDTTGAGDAFFGSLLASFDTTHYLTANDNTLISIFEKANQAGATATQYQGALNTSLFL